MKRVNFPCHNLRFFFNKLHKTEKNYAHPKLLDILIQIHLFDKNKKPNIQGKKILKL